MGNLIESTFQQFFDSIATSNKILQNNFLVLEDRKTKLLQLLENNTITYDAPEGESIYHLACQKALEEMKAQSELWKESLQKQIEKTEFVNKHEKSILTVVFADVKSGKSTLGNFVSTHYLKDTPYENLYQPLSYDVEDFSEASEENRSQRKLPMPFLENEIEATSTIQHYTLNQGLTWVDTPGLHSLTTEHEALAKEYVTFADLVLFLTSSSSPLKEDEQKVLSDLLQQGKAVMVVMTKSDETKMSIENGKKVRKTIGKSQENRTAQEAFVMETIGKITQEKNIENRYVISSSTKLACQAVQTGDEDKFQTSNLPLFFEQMGSILSEKAMELKMQRPKSELNTCIKNLVGQNMVTPSDTSIYGQKRTLQNLILELDTLAQNRDNIVDTIISQLDVRLPVALSSAFRQLRESKMIKDASQVQEAMVTCLTSACTSLCIQTFEEEFKGLQINLTFPKVSLVQGLALSYKEETMVQYFTTVVGRSPENFIEKAQNFFFGTEFTSTTTSRETLVVGDNFSTFLRENWTAVRPTMVKYINLTADKLYEFYISPLRKQYHMMDCQYEELTSEILSLSFE